MESGALSVRPGISALKRTHPVLFYAWILAALIALVGWTLGFAYPLMSVLIRAIGLSRGDGSVVSALVTPSTLAVVRATFFQALMSTIVSVVFGLPLGWILGGAIESGDSHVSRWGRRALPLLAIPFGVPTLVVAFTGICFLGKNGILAHWGVETGLEYSFSGVVFLHALLNIPWIALWVAQARQGMPSHWMEAARTLGANSRQRQIKIAWPWIRSSLVAASLQVFQLCSMSFALVLIFGGGPPVETLETAMVSALKSGEVDWSKAIALAIWQVGLTLIPWVWLAWKESRTQVEGRAAEARGGGWNSQARPLSAFMGFIVSAGFVIPYLIFIVQIPRASFFGVWAVPEFRSGLLNSIRIACASTLLAFFWTLSTVWVLAMIARNSPRLSSAIRIFALLPSGISILVSGLGFWFAYSAWIDPFEGSLPAMAALQAVSLAPWIFRTLWPLVLSLPHRELEAARSLGAAPVRAFFKVERSRWKMPLLTSAAIAFSAAIGEVAAYSLFGAEGKEPLPLLVTRWMGHYRFEDAQAVTAWILLFASGGLALVLVRAHSQAVPGSG